MGWLIALGILTLLAILPLGVSVKYDADGAIVKLIVGPVKITLFPRQKKEKKKKEDKTSETSVPETETAPSPETVSEQAGTEVPEITAPSTQSSASEIKPVEGAKTVPAEVKREPVSQQRAAPQKKVEPASKQKETEPKKPAGGPVTDFLPLVGTVFDFLGNFRRKLRVNRLELKLILAADDPCDLAVNYGRAWAAVGNLWPRLERWLVIKKRDVEVECDFTATETLVIARLDLTITLGRILACVFTFAFHALVEFLKIMKKRKGGASNEPKSS